jgi:hypothetical protein
LLKRPGSAVTATSIQYGIVCPYLVVEASRIGPCCHELGEPPGECPQPCKPIHCVGKFPGAIAAE